MAKPLELYLVRQLSINGKSVIELRYGDIVLWSGNIILLQLEDAAELLENASASGMMIFPDDAIITGLTELKQADDVYAALVNPDSTSIDATLGFQIRDDSSAVKLTLYTMSISDIIKSEISDVSSGTTLNIVSAETNETHCVNVCTNVKAALEPASGGIRDLEPIPVTMQAVQTAGTVTVHESEANEVINIINEQQSSATVGSISELIPKHSEEFIDIVQNSSGAKALVLSVSSQNLRETMTVLSNTTVVRIRPENLSVQVSADMNTQYDIGVYRVFNDSPTIDAEAILSDSHSVKSELTHPTYISPETTLELDESITAKTLLVRPDDTQVYLNLGMNYNDMTIVELYLADWSYPVLTNGKLYVTQTYSAEVVGTKLKLG